jgi:hypothetical protein
MNDDIRAPSHEERVPDVEGHVRGFFFSVLALAVSGGRLFQIVGGSRVQEEL